MEPREEPLTSSLAGDPEMRELIAMFVTDLRERIEDVAEALREGDAPALASLAHQLKGSAGGYGFQSITDRAARLERLVTTGANGRELEGAVGDLLALCRRACLPVER